MAQTVAEIRQQIEALEQKAAELETIEAQAVITRIREAIAHYKFTPSDLFGDKPAVPAKARKASRAAPKAARSLKGTKLPPKYSDGNGNAWTGRGSRPRWLVSALAEGKALESFLV